MDKYSNFGQLAAVSEEYWFKKDDKGSIFFDDWLVSEIKAELPYGASIVEQTEIDEDSTRFVFHAIN
jgi:hypothetical protein